MYDSFSYRVQSVVCTSANVFTSMEFCATLSYDDVSGDYKLSTVDFDAESLGVAVSSVSCRACALLMCHD